MQPEDIEIGRKEYVEALGNRLGQLLFHRVAAPLNNEDRLTLLAQAKYFGAIAVLQASDHTRVYGPNAEVLIDTNHHVN